nr:hypothetical protein [uncultured Draconibacterium sp.]
MKSERIESLAQILEEHGVVANDEQIANIVDDFSLHIEMEAEIQSYGHIDRSGKCDKCEQLQKQLDIERGDSEAYRKFIMKDKQASWVGIENGTVKGTYS